MEIKTNDNIEIKQILMSNGIPAFVEWFSTTDSRNHILSATHFCDTFGYTLEELKKLHQAV